MQNVGLDKSQAGIKIAERNINNLRYAFNSRGQKKLNNIQDHAVSSVFLQTPSSVKLILPNLDTS